MGRGLAHLRDQRVPKKKVSRLPETVTEITPKRGRGKGEPARYYQRGDTGEASTSEKEAKKEPTYCFLGERTGWGGRKCRT